MGLTERIFHMHSSTCPACLLWCVCVFIIQILEENDAEGMSCLGDVWEIFEYLGYHLIGNADFEKNNRFSNKFSTQKPEWVSTKFIIQI